VRPAATPASHCTAAASIRGAGYTPTCGHRNYRCTTGPREKDLVIALGTEVTTLDPQNTSGDGLMVNREIFDALVFPDEKGVIQPNLAEKWTLADDKVTYTFQCAKVSSSRWNTVQR